MSEQPPEDHFLLRDVQGFTAAATGVQRLAIVQEMAGLAYAFSNIDVPTPNFEDVLREFDVDIEWNVEDEDRFQLTAQQIRAGAQIEMLFDLHRHFCRLRDSHSKRIVFQGYLPWIFDVFRPRL